MEMHDSSTWKTFLNWLQQNGLDHRELKLAWSAFEETGRGMQALVEIKPGESILKIPENLLITWPLIVRTHKLDQIPGVHRPSISSHLLLTLYILIQTSLEEKGWCSPYVATLPESFPTLEVLYLNKFDLTSVSPFLTMERIFTQQKKVRADFEELKAFVQKTPQLIEGLGCEPSQITLESFIFGKLVVDLDTFLWAWLVVNTRSVYLNDPKNPTNPKDPSPIALVPYLDLLNHNPQTKVSDVYDSKTGSFVFVSGQKYSPGEQVFIAYGAHDNLALMTEYGFTISNNPYDHVCLDYHVWNHLLCEESKNPLFPLENFEKEVFNRLSPRPIFETLQKNGLLRNFAIQSDGEPDFRLMNFLRLWHLPCYDTFSSTLFVNMRSKNEKPAGKYSKVKVKGTKNGIPTLAPSLEKNEMTEDDWLNLWYSIWSGFSESFSDEYISVEKRVYSTLLDILSYASHATFLKLANLRDKVANGGLSYTEKELLSQIQTILETDNRLLDKAKIWTRENFPVESN